MFMNILDPNQTINFITPLYDNPNIVRTGVISDGSCLIHCILFGISPKYRNSNISEKKSIVKDLRKSIQESITKDQYLKLNNSELSKIRFSQCFHERLDEIYKEKEDNGPQSFFKSIISKEEIETIVNKNMNKDLYYVSTLIIIQILELFNKKLVKQIKLMDKYTDKITKCSNFIKDLFHNMIHESINNSFEIFCNEINSDSYLGHEHIELLSEIFQVNLLFIDSKTRLPYEFGSLDLKYNDCVIILWLEEHFEIVGLMDENNIKRKFSKNDEIVQLFK